VSELVEKLLMIHESLIDAGLRHAFGGAIALAYCTREPRGTRDLDLNVFVEPSRAEEALAGLPRGIRVERADIEAAAAEGQRRLWWSGVPIDVFLNALPLHREVEERVLWVPLGGREVPVVDCASLVAFKALIGRTRDWADIEAVAACSPESVKVAAATVARQVGSDDPLTRRLEELGRSGRRS
jgi:hypothetical protein